MPGGDHVESRQTYTSMRKTVPVSSADEGVHEEDHDEVVRDSRLRRSRQLVLAGVAVIVVYTVIFVVSGAFRYVVIKMIARITIPVYLIAAIFIYVGRLRIHGTFHDALHDHMQTVVKNAGLSLVTKIRKIPGAITYEVVSEIRAFSEWQTNIRDDIRDDILPMQAPAKTIDELAELEGKMADTIRGIERRLEEKIKMVPAAVSHALKHEVERMKTYISNEWHKDDQRKGCSCERNWWKDMAK